MRTTDEFKIVLSLIVFLFVNSLSYSQDGVLTGKVRYQDSALQSATVSLGKKTRVTDSKGRFSFSIEPGIYTIIISHAGYKEIKKTITMEPGITRNFDVDMVPNVELGEIVLLGSRSPTPRSNLNTAVPVDAFSSTELTQTGQTSLMQMLNYTAPSLNASLQNAFEPVTLRGLYPDQVLILLNGTRYSNSAFLNFGTPRGQIGRSSVVNDLNSIPSSAIEKIEILRDGASAQYGSDAVAGVINILLKESTGKTSVSFHVGQQYKGDGENMRLGIYRGFALNKKSLPAGRQGFLNFSADIRYRKPTFRGGEYLGTVYYPILDRYSSQQRDSIIELDNKKIKESGFDRIQVSNAGNSKLTSFGILINGSYEINKNAKLFWTGSTNNTSFTFLFPYTLPKASSQVNTVLFPNGFKGSVKPDIWNVSGIVGIRGKTENGIYWDYSSAYGMNSIKFNSANTNNASQQFDWGSDAPTDFYTGTQFYQQLTNTIQFTKTLSISGNNLRTVNLHWGAELRFEKFKMKEGEQSSWDNYDTSGRKLGGSQTSLIISPNDALNKGRSVVGTYIDLELDFKNRLLLDVAGRFEHYSDFGSNLAGKLAARYKISDIFSVRASISNGFRAPSMQQRYWGTIFSGFIRTANSSTPTTGGIFNNEHAVTKQFGVPNLDAEKSLNISGGITSTISRHFYLTIDGYWIQIKNRVVHGGAFNRKNPEVDSLLSDPSLNVYDYVTQVSFFSNAINTRTHGIDAVLHGKWDFHKSQLAAVLSANFTSTHLYGEVKTAANLSATPENENTLFNEEQRVYLEHGQPESKIILSLNYKIKKWGFILRNTRFGETAFQNVDKPKETFSPKILTDFSISCAPKPWLSLTAGANNIFDVYPDRIKDYGNTSEGMFIYATQASPFGYNGGYYFVSTNFNF